MNSYYNDGFFNINSQNGFLPFKHPLPSLPSEFSDLQSITDKLSSILQTEGLIVTTISQLTDYTNQIKSISDKYILAALFRAYTFITSAFLLEPSYHEYKRTKTYGKARNVLPQCLAVPLHTLSPILDVYPWLDYAYAYSLGNWILKNESKGITWDNLKLAVSFSGTEDEAGFILVHVDINNFSKDLVRGGEKLLNGIEVGCIINTQQGLSNILTAMKNINERRREMWNASNPNSYNNFRIFIMGITGNESLFGDGVIYEGVSDIPQKYRGQSGSQDSIIPYLDSLLRVIDRYPKNELTEYLYDMRKYRPKVFQKYIDDTEIRSRNIIKKIDEYSGVCGLSLLFDILEQVYFFRNGHWQFVQRYIMMNTKYPVATGGTPITSWIPNQIEATLQLMKDVIDKIYLHTLDQDIYPDRIINQSILDKYKFSLNMKIKLLKDQIQELKKIDYDIKLFYFNNFSSLLSDTQSVTL
jgi:indoleamine 2,3-dioxygenase